MIRGVNWLLEEKFTQPKEGEGWKCLCDNISLFRSCQHSPWQKQKHTSGAQYITFTYSQDDMQDTYAFREETKYNVI